MVVDCGKEMLAIEMDADTVVSCTLVKGSDDCGELEATSVCQDKKSRSRKNSTNYSKIIHRLSGGNSRIEATCRGTGT